jgi:hypothetical protein
MFIKHNFSEEETNTLEYWKFPFQAFKHKTWMLIIFIFLYFVGSQLHQSCRGTLPFTGIWQNAGRALFLKSGID